MGSLDFLTGGRGEGDLEGGKLEYVACYQVVTIGATWANIRRKGRKQNDLRMLGNAWNFVCVKHRIYSCKLLHLAHGILRIGGVKWVSTTVGVVAGAGAVAGIGVWL